MVQAPPLDPNGWGAGHCTPAEVLVAYMRETGCTAQEAQNAVRTLEGPRTPEQLKIVFGERCERLPCRAQTGQG